MRISILPLFIFFLTSTFLYSQDCSNVSISSNCLEVNENITISIDNAFGFQLTNPDGTNENGFGNSINFTPSESGYYNIEFISFQNCITTIFVPDQEFELSVNDEISICDNSILNYEELDLDINFPFNTVYPDQFSYTFSTVPFSGVIWNLGDQIIIPSSTLQIEVNVQDNLSGCSDTKFIDVNFLETNATSNFTSSSNELICQGQEFIFNALDVNVSQFEYNWFIDGEFNLNDTLLITNLTSSDDEINIVLEVIDLNNGCVASSSDTINSFNSSNYIAFDTSLNDSISLCFCIYKSEFYSNILFIF